MKPTPVLNFRDFISVDGEALSTTSLKVATVFGKQHAKVMRDCRNLMAQLPPEYRLANFGETVYMRENPSGGAMIASTVITISRDGFTLLAMGFTGAKALMFKLAYIRAFNDMAAYIKNQRDGLSYRCMQKELECKDSVRRGTIHGRGLNLRRQELNSLKIDMAALMAEAQRPLNLN